MIAQAAIRKAALLASVMDPRSRRRLLASLEPDTAGQVGRAIQEVGRRGWNRRELVQLILVPDEGQASEAAGGIAETRMLADHLDSASFSRVLAAQGGDRRDFLLSLLDPDYAREVRTHLTDMPVLPERLRAATLTAAAELVECAREGAL